jgi:uncharacterized protein with PIN domain
VIVDASALIAILRAEPEATACAKAIAAATRCRISTLAGAAAIWRGDCFAYALARATGEPLLFKGGDFLHTDITPALI